MQKQKQPYTTPQLTRYGALEDVTKTINKSWGARDGMLFATDGHLIEKSIS